ncbi:hypothetical protein V6N13_040534 [Hibiscus sabdariffa]
MCWFLLTVQVSCRWRVADGGWGHDERLPHRTGKYGISAVALNQAMPRISESDVRASRHRISVYLTGHTAYKLLPESGKVVALPVKQAFHILSEQKLHPIQISKKKSIFLPPKTVSYLKNKCGLSLESALRASKYVYFETPAKPDSVLAVLESHGFSKPQITRLIKRRPVLLNADVKTTILPKLEFLISKGVSVPDLAYILSNNPTFLSSSLENQIIPSYNFLSTLLESDEKVFLAVRRYPRLMGYSPYDILLTNINTLLDIGVAGHNIASSLCSLPSTFVRNPNKFKVMVAEAKDIGLNPTKPMFLVALYAIRSLSKPTWKRKFELFKKFGWSEEEVLEAFRRYPTFVRLSEDKFMVTMDFLVNKMGFSSSVIAKRPRLLLMSMEKKIVPRGLFALDLVSKGVIRRINLQTLLETSDNVFIENFVKRHKEEAPQLLKLYHENNRLQNICSLSFTLLEDDPYHDPRKRHDDLAGVRRLVIVEAGSNHVEGNVRFLSVRVKYNADNLPKSSAPVSCGAEFPVPQCFIDVVSFNH